MLTGIESCEGWSGFLVSLGLRQSTSEKHALEEYGRDTAAAVHGSFRHGVDFLVSQPSLTSADSSSSLDRMFASQ